MIPDGLAASPSALADPEPDQTPVAELNRALLFAFLFLYERQGRFGYAAAALGEGLAAIECFQLANGLLQGFGHDRCDGQTLSQVPDGILQALDQRGLDSNPNWDFRHGFLNFVV
jgi:hypothetical protein